MLTYSEPTSLRVHVHENATFEVTTLNSGISIDINNFEIYLDLKAASQLVDIVNKALDRKAIDSEVQRRLKSAKAK